MHKHMHMNIYIYIYIYNIHVRIHMHCLHMDINILIHIHLYTTYTCIQTHTYAHTHTLTITSRQTSEFICMQMFICIFIYAWAMFNSICMISTYLHTCTCSEKYTHTYWCVCMQPCWCVGIDTHTHVCVCGVLAWWCQPSQRRVLVSCTCILRACMNAVCGLHDGWHQPFLHACHWDKASRCTARTREAASCVTTLTKCVLCVCVPEQGSPQQSDHDAACGRVPGPHVASKAVSSSGMWLTA